MSNTSDKVFLKKLSTIFFLISFALYTAQQGYQVKTSERDGYIDLIKGQRTYEKYYELDYDTGKVFNEHKSDCEIYVNFIRRYSNDTVGDGMITYYYGSRSIKLPFDQVKFKNNTFHFFYNEILFAYYYSDYKTFVLVDKTKRVYKTYKDLD